MTTKNKRVKHAGDRDRILTFMEDAGLTYDLARSEDPPKTVLNSLRFFQGLGAALQKKGIVYPEPVPTGIEAEEWNQIDRIIDRAVDVYAASRIMGLREGIERCYAASTIGDYYKNYPERLLIAKYIRKHHDASPNDICKYIDTEERKRISSLPPGLPSPRPYPLPWESKPLKERISLSMEDLRGRMEWVDALALGKKKNKEHVDKTKKEDRKVRYLRTFLSKEKTRALHNKDAQMYFAWTLAAEKGMVIEPDRDGGFRQVTFGSSWRHLQSIGLEISPELEKVLREREGADQRRASGRSYRRTLGDLGDLYRSRRSARCARPSQNS